MKTIKNKLRKSISSILLINKIKNYPINRENKIKASPIFFIIDNEFLIQKLNVNASLLLGDNRRNLMRQNFLDFIAQAHQNEFQEKIKLVLQNNSRQICDIQIAHKDGTINHVILQCCLIKKKFIYIKGIDTTSVRQAETRVDYGNLNLIRDLFNNAQDAIAVLDEQLNFQIINKSFSDSLFHITSNTISAGVNLKKVLKDNIMSLRIINACENALEGNKTNIFIENPNKNSDIYYCYEINLSSVYDQAQQKNRLIFRIKNITDYKLQHKLQADIALVCKNSVIEAMTSALAHELNQPLTAIATYSQSCLYMVKNKSHSDGLAEQLSSPLQKIFSQAELAGEIILNMKKFMREEQIYVEKTDINQLIHDSLSIVYYEFLNFKLKITLNLAEELPQVLINKTHITQVILNLVRNSVEAFQNVHEKNPELIFETSLSQDCIQVIIKDNGPGIPEEYVDKILSSCFTTKIKGTGIGLNICRTLVENHGGTLSFQPNADKGTGFMFTLPLKSARDANESI